MRSYGLGWIAWGVFLFQGGFALAQNSLDALEQELNEAKQQHQEVTTKALSDFFNQINAAMGSPDAAVALYQQAGGNMPSPSPVISEHENETVTEKDARAALDQATLTKLGAVLQLHCGLMYYAVLFVVKPDQKGLQEDWVAWLKSAAQIYPQLSVPLQTSDPQHDRGDPRRRRPPPFSPEELKGTAMRASLISKYLDFKGWGQKEQGGWSIRDVPKFYRAQVLEPLRTAPTSATLAAWDIYIAMMNSDEPDNDRWSQVVYPPLQFDRACDDYAVDPSTEKLEALVNLIKANPTYPQVDDWISRVHQLMDGYRARHGGNAPAAQNAAPAPTGDPNVTVSTVKQGDMTIVTTHTNAAPANPPPAH